MTYTGEGQTYGEIVIKKLTVGILLVESDYVLLQRKWNIASFELV